MPLQFIGCKQCSGLANDAYGLRIASWAVKGMASMLAGSEPVTKRRRGTYAVECIDIVPSLELLC